MKKTVNLCDLCKEDFDESSSSKIVIKKGDKKDNHKFDICPSCIEKLETQLVSNQKLSQKWNFVNTVLELEIPERSIRRQNLESLDNDDLLINEKEEARIEALKEVPEIRDRITHSDNIVPFDKTNCSHVNKSREMLGTIVKSDGSKKKGFYRRCTNCGEQLPCPTMEEKANYMNAKLKTQRK